MRRVVEAAGQACSGYLVEHDGFRLLVDPGYATVPRLLERITADQVDAVFISHGHPDHCADLNPLLRARALRDDPPAPLPVYSLPSALDAVLALDRPGMLTDAYVLHEFNSRRPDRHRPVPRADPSTAALGAQCGHTADSGRASAHVHRGHRPEP
ncbi:MBL fold metallo-hydrolase [Nonomuraea ferruginea]